MKSSALNTLRSVRVAFRVMLGAFAPCLAVSSAWGADSVMVSESQAKARWLLGFATYTEWKEEDFAAKDSAFIFGILGSNPFAQNEIDFLRSKTIRKRKVEVRLFKAIDEVVACQVLYVSPSEKRNLGSILKQLSDRRVLTISDLKEFFLEGGLVRLDMLETEEKTRKPIPDINPAVKTKGNWEFDPSFLAAIKSLQQSHKVKGSS
jgi:hypothetical protein